MAYVVIVLVALALVIETFLRMRSERRMKAEYKVYVAEAQSDLLKRFTEAINAAMDAESKRVDDVLKLDRLNVEKALKSIRVSYATLFQGFVAHADAYHLHGGIGNKVPWPNLAPLRPIAAIAKMMKAQQALKDHREKNTEEPVVPEAVPEEGAAIAGDVKVEGRAVDKDGDLLALPTDGGPEISPPSPDAKGV